ncbi:hypothetical protein ACMD2_03839, partial [Ananas comosus]
HVPSGKPGVHQAVPAALLDERGRPLDDLALDPAGQLLDGSAGGGGLEEEDAEAVDVAALGDLPPHCVLRREVAERALDAGGEVRDAVGDELREAKVGDLRGKVGVQEHVAGLDVPVDYVRTCLMVQSKIFCNLREALGSSNGDLHPERPIEHMIGGVAAVEVADEAVVRHVVVDDEPLVPAGVESSKAQEVFMPHPPKYLYLDREFHLRLRLPNPPSPSLLLSLKLFVACRSSFKV